MNEKRISIFLKFLIAGVALCLIGFLGLFIPHLGRAVVMWNPDYAHCYWPWVILCWGVGVPVFVGLWQCWLVADDLGKGDAFTQKNADRFEVVAFLCAGDGLLFFVVNVVYAFLNMSHPGVTLGALILLFVSVGAALTLKILGHYTRNAAKLREEAELTI